jgi:hypothetical protein
MRRHRVTFALASALAAALSLAQDAAPTRDEYDAFMAAFAMDQHRVGCERYASGVYEAFQEQVAAWRTANEATLRRLEPAARNWQLPGNASLDELLDHISVSMNDYYASLGQEAADARCKRLFRVLRPVTTRWSGP